MSLLSLKEKWMQSKEKLLYIGVIVPLLIVVLLLQIYKVDPFESFSLRFNDVNFALQKKEISKDIVFVAVDEPSVNKFGRWPWDRKIIAQGISHLSQADVVLMDMIFSEPTNEKDDALLAQSLSGFNASVCGFFLRSTSTQPITDEALDILSDSSLDLLQSQIAQFHTPKFISAPFAEMNIVPILRGCSLSGSFSALPESDHLLRSYPSAVYFQGVLYPSLAMQGLRLKLNKDIKRVDARDIQIGRYKIGLNKKGFTKLNYYNLNQYNIVSFLDVYDGKVKPEYFKNKIVILGITDVGSGDVASTPIGNIPGPLLHYTFLSNVLQGQLIVEPDNVTPMIIVFMVFLPLLLLFLIKRVAYRIVINITLYLLVYGFIKYLFVADMIYIDMFYPLIALILSVIAVEAVAFNVQEKRGKFLKDTFSSYMSGDLLAQLIKNPASLKLGGEKKELSILFSDIRGFTTLSESMSPEKLIKILNRYFTPMTESVLENGGLLDKYIGDAVMAFFNAPVNVTDHPDAACRTALEMIQRLDKLNLEFASEGINPIKIGIGINTAEVIVGNIGSDAKKDYTVIGDGVNLASRVEGLTKNYGIQILITEFTVAKLSSDFIYRKIEPVKVKGKDEAVLLYELMPDTEISKDIKEKYDAALNVYEALDFDNAQKLFEILVEKYSDSVSAYFLPLVKEKHPWGVHKMNTK